MADNFLYIESGENIRAVFFDYQVKVISAPDDRLEQREQMISASFDASYVLQAQRIAPNVYAVVAAEEELIKNIHGSFKPRKIETLIPYGAAIRAFCSCQHIGLDKLVVFADDAQGRVLVTICDGLSFSPPRVLSADHLSVEIKRTLQNYYAEYPQTQEKEVQIVASKDFNVASVALEGLKAAQFAIHFDLPQEVLKQKYLKAAGRRLRTVLMALALLLLGLSAYAGAWFYKQNQDKELAVAQNQHQDLLGQLAQAHQAKIGGVLKGQPRLKYALYYHQFLRHIPDDYFIKDLRFQKLAAGQWQIEGVIYPADASVRQQKFFNEGIFAEAKSVSVEVDHVLGEKIISTVSF